MPFNEARDSFSKIAGILVDDDMSEGDLFRAEALGVRRNGHYGVVRINTPIRYTAVTLGFFLLVILIFAFLMLGEFSEKFIVTGYLESTKGVVRIYPNKNGVIVTSYIKQGDVVKQGDKLFLIDTSYEGMARSARSEGLIQLEKRKKSLESELTYKKRHLQALKALLIKKYISVSAYDEKHDELVQLKSQIHQVNAAMIRHNHESSYEIRSPIDGVISSVLYQSGQYTQLSKPLLKILPANADLMAELLIPARQSGFVKPKSQVIVRYDAYPYERFGSSKATIEAIGQSILTDEEDNKPIRMGKPYYKATALLDKQFVTIYGQNKKIQHGMTISAVIVGSKRKIWQWILEPLYSFYGEVFL